MSTPRFIRALRRPEGLQVVWADVPEPDAHGSLLLSLFVERQPWTGLQFGVKWVRGASDSPHVFVWRSADSKQLNHSHPREVIARGENGEVVVLFPLEWLDHAQDGDAHGRALVNVDGRDVDSAHIDLDFDD